MNIRLWAIALTASLGMAFPALWGCDYGRMKQQESIHTYETVMPEMPGETIPVEDGYEIMRKMNPEELKNPLPSNREVVERGRNGYAYYCAMCHGPRADGNGTVGQSFAPLPRDLKNPYVQKQSDGELFHKISFGFARHPPLAYVVAEGERWAIIHYIRSLAAGKEG